MKLLARIKELINRKRWRKSIVVGDIVLVQRNASEGKKMRVVTLPDLRDNRIGVYTVSTGYELYPLNKVYKCASDK